MVRRPATAKGLTMLSHYPPRQAPAKPNRRAGKCRSFRALCQANHYSAALTTALLNTAAMRYAQGLPVAWPRAC